MLKSLAGLAGVLLMPFDRLGRLTSAPAASADAGSEGELYAGFLLLPEGVPAPSYVRGAKRGAPVFGEPGPGKTASPSAARSTYLASEAELARVVGTPCYTLANIPGGARRTKAVLIQHSTGDPYLGQVGFETYDREVDAWETTIALEMLLDFPQPFPLWSCGPREPGGPVISFRKAEFLPVPGVMVSTARGYVFHWIQYGALYTARVEYDCSLTEAQSVIASLETIG